MHKPEILHFQYMHIDNALLRKTPILEANHYERGKLRMVFVRNPYDYFDAMLFDYLKTKKSLLFTHDIIDHMATLEGTAFLEWLDTLNFIPFYNPQTFFLDVKKRVDIAIDNLKNFDYPVLYEESSLFIENTALDIHIIKNTHPKLTFSINNYKEHPVTQKLLKKDLELYANTKKLWTLIKENRFHPLGDFIEKPVIYTLLNEAVGFRGRCGGLNAKMIRGFAFYKDAQKPLTLEIYKNNELLTCIHADVARPELKNQFKLTYDTCGFQVNFEKDTFKKGDTVDVIIVPENIKLPLIGNAEAFLG